MTPVILKSINHREGRSIPVKGALILLLLGAGLAVPRWRRPIGPMRSTRRWPRSFEGLRRWIIGDVAGARSIQAEAMSSPNDMVGRSRLLTL